MVFHWSLSDSKSPQVSRTLLSILADCSNAVFWMVSILLLIPRFSKLFSNLFGTVPSAPTTIGITFTLIFHSFFNSLAMSLSIFSFSFSFTLWYAGTANSTSWHVVFFFVNQYKVWSAGWDRVIRLYLKLLLLLLLLLLFHSVWAFHTRVSWWCFI